MMGPDEIIVAAHEGGAGTEHAHRDVVGDGRRHIRSRNKKTRMKRRILQSENRRLQLHQRRGRPIGGGRAVVFGKEHAQIFSALHGAPPSTDSASFADYL